MTEDAMTRVAVIMLSQLDVGGLQKLLARFEGQTDGASNHWARQIPVVGALRKSFDC